MTTTHVLYPDRVVLRSGRLADVDERGRAELVTCPWLVQVPSGHPEPDSEADCWLTIPCGAPAFAIDGDADAGWRCSNGHHHFTYGSARQQAEERLEALAEARAEARYDARDEAREWGGEDIPS